METEICTETLKDGEVASASSTEKVEEVERDEFVEGDGEGEVCEDKLEKKKEVERKLNDSDEEVDEVAEISESGNVGEVEVAEVRNFEEKKEEENKGDDEKEAELENEEGKEEEEAEVENLA